MKKAHVTHPELKCTFCLSILGVKKNPNGTSFTQLGVITKGTVIEVCCPGLPCEALQCHLLAKHVVVVLSHVLLTWEPAHTFVSCDQMQIAVLMARAARLCTHIVFLLQVNVSELGLVTPGGKVVWGKYAQVTNNPENDGCINAVLLV